MTMDSMGEVALEFRLTGDGWSESTFRVGDDGVELVAGYLSDALGDLVRAALLIARGPTLADVIWDSEPYQYRWHFERDGDAVDVRVAGDDQWVDGDAGTTLLHRTCSVGALCASIADGASVVLSQHGADGYLDLWGLHPFPVEALEALRAEVPFLPR